ncbi:class A beta-lactamase [Thauera sinica]|uniref:beta-lactamase n=1 Tax=Thauera sinica TaxID=2665146 RepID=A0ABW1ANL2_9RHOO|nr:class A beta-lactamase [Thauera sp. K11]
MPERQDAVAARLQALEADVGGRLGVYVVDTQSGAGYGYRPDERFLMLSSFKLLASALVLHRVDAGLDSLARRISYGREDLVPWSPVTGRHAGGEGMTLAGLCEAAVTTSDNTAANLILASYGGPAALTAYLRQLGDTVTRLDRNEPTLNDKHPHEPFDTTSPRAMVGSMRKLVLGEALSAASRERLQQWLLGNTTGGRRLKAGLPADWRIGDKTGTAGMDANDVGVVWPPGRAPLLVAAYLADSPAEGAAREAAIADVGRLLRDIAR